MVTIGMDEGVSAVGVRDELGAASEKAPPWGRVSRNVSGSGHAVGGAGVAATVGNCRGCGIGNGSGEGGAAVEPS